MSRIKQTLRQQSGALMIVRNSMSLQRGFFASTSLPCWRAGRDVSTVIQALPWVTTSALLPATLAVCAPSNQAFNAAVYSGKVTRDQLQAGSMMDEDGKVAGRAAATACI